MNDHDYFCECDECTEEMYASLDRANAALKKWGAGPIITRNLPPRPAPGESPCSDLDLHERLAAEEGEAWHEFRSSAALSAFDDIEAERTGRTE